MRNHLIVAVLLLIVSLGIATVAHAVPIVAGALTGKDPIDKPLLFTWEVTWNKRYVDSVVSTEMFDPKPVFWSGSFSIVDIDGDRIYDDLSVHLFHRDDGPDAAEGVDHDDGELYSFGLRNAFDNLPKDGPARKIAGSVKPKPLQHSLVRPGKGPHHRDDIWVEYIPGNIDFTVHGVHVAEPSSYLLFTTGLLGLLGYGWRRKRTA